MTRNGAPADVRRERGQSSVVGVALLLGMTVVALGVLTASVGALVEGHAARADADRVAADLQSGLRPVESTGHRTTTVRFAGGRLYTAERRLRVSDAAGTVAAVDIGALVYENADRRVAAVAGAVVRGRGENAWLVEDPPIVGSDSNGVLVVGAANLSATPSSVGGGVTAKLSANVTHDRRSLGRGRYEVAVETEAPAAFERYFADRGASVSRSDLDGDGVVSVVAEFPGRRRAYLVEHRMRLEVADG
ncbi:DUF7289 family protein [Halosimplex halophilum]|uniref:DUF7289 family protein n=1 Tax=Halosimplex halophilum TaxID=2559572 RepID=UPI00107F843B|nr:archaellin/type IV pilin N-terminal domain-containing protein [Halosimplex halophilum]